MMKRIHRAALLLALVPALSVAHGTIIPKRGGLVAWAGELSIELARRESGEWHVFVDDHGVPFSLAGATGSLDVMASNGSVQPVALREGKQGPSALIAGTLVLAPGDLVQVIVNLADGQVLVARIAVDSTL